MKLQSVERKKSLIRYPILSCSECHVLHWQYVWCARPVSKILRGIMVVAGYFLDQQSLVAVKVSNWAREMKHSSCMNMTQIFKLQGTGSPTDFLENLIAHRDNHRTPQQEFKSGWFFMTRPIVPKFNENDSQARIRELQSHMLVRIPLTSQMLGESDAEFTEHYNDLKALLRANRSFLERGAEKPFPAGHVLRSESSHCPRRSGEKRYSRRQPAISQRAR